MNIERENLKDILSQFVDTLVDNEVAEIRAELEQTQKSIREEMSTLKNDIILEMSQVKEGINSELLAMRKSRTELEAKGDEFAQKESNIYKHLKTFAVKMAETFSEQESDYTDIFKKLEERVHRNEDTLFVTRNDHDKLSLVLNTFATGLSEMSPSPSEPQMNESVEPDQAPSLTQPIEPQTSAFTQPVEPQHSSFTQPIEPQIVEQQQQMVHPADPLHLQDNSMPVEIPVNDPNNQIFSHHTVPISN